MYTMFIAFALIASGMAGENNVSPQKESLAPPPTVAEAPVEMLGEAPTFTPLDPSALGFLVNISDGARDLQTASAITSSSTYSYTSVYSYTSQCD